MARVPMARILVDRGDRKIEIMEVPAAQAIDAARAIVRHGHRNRTYALIRMPDGAEVFIRNVHGEAKREQEERSERET